MRLIVVLGLLVVAGVAWTPASAQQPIPPCTPSQLARTELVDGHLPFVVWREGDRVDGALLSRAEHRFDVTVTGDVIASSIRVFAPGGELGPATSPGFRAFRLLTGDAGTLPLTMTWEQEVLDASGIPTTQRCAGAGVARLTVRDASFVVLERIVRRAQFSLIARPGVSPNSTATLTFELRVRRGSARPPSLSTRTYARFSYPAEQLGPERSSDRVSVRGIGEFKVVPGVRGPNARARMYLTPGLVPRGQTRRFGFSLRVLQGSRVVGGMRSGATCRGTTRRSLVCSRSSYAARP